VILKVLGILVDCIVSKHLTARSFTNSRFFIIVCKGGEPIYCWCVSLCKHVSSIGESDSPRPMKRRRHYSGLRLLETRSRQGIERWHCTIYCPQLLRHISLRITATYADH